MKVKSKALLILVMISLLLGVFASSTALAGEHQQQTRFVAPILVANTSFLNVRSGPGVQFTVTVTVVGGTELPVLGVASDLTWYQISTIVGPGWVNVQYTLPRGDFSNVPFVSVDSFAQAQVGGGFGVAGLGQGGGATSVGGVSVGGVGVNTRVGSTSNRNQWGVSVTVSHPLRSGPTQNSSSPGNINPDDNVVLTLLESQSAEGITWFRVDIPDVGIYWVEGPKTKFRPYGCNLSVVTLTAQVTPNVGPDGSGDLDGTRVFEAGTEAYLLDNQNGQFKVEFVDGSIGWIRPDAAAVRDQTLVRVDYCTSGIPAGGGATVGGSLGQGGGGIVPAPVLRPRLDTPHVVVNTGFLNIRSGPGAQYTAIATVSGGTQLPVIGIYFDDVWLLVQGRFGRGWVNSEYVLFRGDGSSLPIIRDAGGIVSAPIALVSTTINLYAAPSVALGTLGTVTGPLELPIVALSADGLWVQVNTGVGFGWVLAEQILISGDLSSIPVISG
jgi:uncharacterized protein YraI